MVLKPQGDRMTFQLSCSVCSDVGLISSWAPCHSLDLFSCSDSTFYLLFQAPLTVPYILFIPCLRSPFLTALCSILWELQPSACAGSDFYFLNKKPLTSLTSAPPPQVSCGHFGSVNAPSHPKKRKEKRLCPPSLTPTKSISWQVGDKSNSVTLAARVMLGGWQRTSPSNRCQHCHCCLPTQHEPYREREVVVEGEEEGQIWLGGTGCCRAAMIRKIEASNFVEWGAAWRRSTAQLWEE